jgi:hypothetical protein
MNVPGVKNLAVYFPPGGIFGLAANPPPPLAMSSLGLTQCGTAPLLTQVTD